MLRRLWPIALAALMACGASETCARVIETCPRGGTCQSCAGAAGSRYKCSDGTVYACQASDCTSAAREASFWCAAH